MNKFNDKQLAKPVKISGRQINEFINKHKDVRVVDQVHDQIEELFLLRNPRFRFEKNFDKYLMQFKKEQKQNIAKGSWFFYPWLSTVVYFLPENLHFEIKTGRNRNLITAEEQKKFYNSCIGVAGMSVGSHVALTIALTTGSKHIKLADPDSISASNLNRIRAGFHNVGIKKVVSVARQIYEINPYSTVEIFDHGITPKNLQLFIHGKGKLDVLVEEMDNPYLKVLVREKARKEKVPVIMAADNGDGIIVDVERYDLDKKYPLLHGIIEGLSAEEFKHVSPTELPQVIAKMAGANLAVPRMLSSVVEVGKTLYSWPQLGTAATMCGAVLAYLARKIVLNDQKVRSGRKAFGPEKFFEID